MLNEETLEWNEMTPDQVEQQLRKEGGRFSSACATIWETKNGYCVSDDCVRHSKVKIFTTLQFQKAVRTFNKLSK